MERAFAHRKEVSPDQMMQLHAFLAGEDARTMGSARCREVAAQLHLPYEAVSWGAGRAWEAGRRQGRRQPQPPHC